MYKALVKMRNKKGFTLMELLIVVAIIAILAAIAIPTFSSSLEKSKLAADEANCRSLYAAVAMHYMTDDALPTIGGSGTSLSLDGVTYTFNYAPDIATVAGTSWTITAQDKDGNDIATSSWTLNLA